MFKRIGIIARRDNPPVRETLSSLVSTLNRRGVDLVLEEHCAAWNLPGTYRAVAEKMLGEGRDLVITVGGDGTLLRAAKAVFPRKVALMGINMGRLGFLADLSPAEIATGLTEILDGSYTSEDRFVLNCEVLRAGAFIAESQGLNDIVIQKWNTARLITFDTLVNGRFVHSQRSDGMVVSTPTGSTAYAMAGGGPILHPDLDAIVLVPICPHTLTNRPVVISSSSTVEIRIGTDRDDESRVTCDGNALSQLAPGDVVRVARHADAVRLIHPASHDHYATLRAKLHWSRDPC